MWFYAALGMALISGFYTILSKHTLKKIDPIVFYWVVILFSMPFILPLAIKEGIPDFSHSFFIGVVGSVIFYSISKIIFYQVIQKTDLSRIHPLISLSPISTVIFSAIILSERYTGMEFVAMAVTLFGTYVLNISSVREGLLEPFKILFRNKLALWMLVSVALGGLVAIFDKVAINNTFPESLAFAILVENIIIVIAFLPWIISKRKTALPQISLNKKPLFALGLLMASSTLLAFMALSQGDAGVVTSIFRTQVFFVLLFSFVFFKDRPKAETIAGSVIMIAGLVLLKLVGN